MWKLEPYCKREKEKPYSYHQKSTHNLSLSLGLTISQSHSRCSCKCEIVSLCPPHTTRLDRSNLPMANALSAQIACFTALIMTSTFLSRLFNFFTSTYPVINVVFLW